MIDWDFVVSSPIPSGLSTVGGFWLSYFITSIGGSIWFRNYLGRFIRRLSCSLTSPVGTEARLGVVGITAVTEGVVGLSLSVAVSFIVLIVEVSAEVAISVSAVFFSSEGEMISYFQQLT